MNYFSLLREPLVANWPQLLIFAALSGAASTSVLAVINRANTVLDPDVRASSLLLLLLAILIYSVSHKALMVAAAALAERAVDRLRVSLERRLRSALLRRIESLDRNQLYASVSAEMQALADGTVNLALVGHSLILVVITAGYLLFLSVTAVVFAVTFSVGAAYIYLRRSKETAERYNQAFRLDARLLSIFSDVINGFKEVKLNTPRSEEIGREIQSLSDRAASVRLMTRSVFATDLVLSQVAFYLLIGLMVFVVPMFTAIDRDTLSMITAGTLFLVGPISFVVGGIPVLQRVNAAATTIMSVLAELPEPREDSNHFYPVGLPSKGVIKMQQASFGYDDSGEHDFAASSFLIGPIDLEIKCGELVVITGSNGSGIPTLLKLLTGLYLPTSGAINATVALEGTTKEVRVLGDRPFPLADLVAYQNLFSAIFSDYHLFRKFYGIPTVDPDQAKKWLQLVELDNKVHVIGREFDDINLSSGQRKRLAMVGLLMENRPVCVFDEWAADQDKHFRDKFYFTILPMLLNQHNKTIIVVAHDIEYFKSDRIPEHTRFHMELHVDAENRTRALLRKLEPGEDPF